MYQFLCLIRCAQNLKAHISHKLSGQFLASTSITQSNKKYGKRSASDSWGEKKQESNQFRAKAACDRILKRIVAII